MSKKVLCIGTATVDNIAVIPSDKIEKINFINADSSHLLLETGRKLEVESLDSFYGGGAINAAISMQRLGLDVDCFVKVGDDYYGQKIIEHLEKSHIGTKHIVKSSTHQTATSILVSSHDRDPAILTYRGANAQISDQEIPWDDLVNYDAIYVTNLSEQSAKVYSLLIDRAHSNNIKVISNPGIKQLKSGNNTLLQLLAKIDVLVINRVEAEELSSYFLENQIIKPYKKMPAKSSHRPLLYNGKMEMFAEDFLKVLANIGVEFSVVTDGKKGAYLYHDGKFTHIKSKPVAAIGTAGAGDAFCSTLAALWLQGMDIERAGVLAAKNATSVVKTLDAQSGLLQYDELTGANS